MCTFWTKLAGVLGKGRNQVDVHYPRIAWSRTQEPIPRHLNHPPWIKLYRWHYRMNARGHANWQPHLGTHRNCLQKRSADDGSDFSSHSIHRRKLRRWSDGSVLFKALTSISNSPNSSSNPCICGNSAIDSVSFSSGIPGTEIACVWDNLKFRTRPFGTSTFFWGEFLALLEEFWACSSPGVDFVEELRWRGNCRMAWRPMWRRSRRRRLSRIVALPLAMILESKCPVSDYPICIRFFQLEEEHSLSKLSKSGHSSVCIAYLKLVW